MGMALEERYEEVNEKVCGLPQRYRRLVVEVLERLPKDWLEDDPPKGNGTISWAVVVSDDIHYTTQRGCAVLASAAPEQFQALQYWTITLFPHVPARTL